jgi:hypothetical protein
MLCAAVDGYHAAPSDGAGPRCPPGKTGIPSGACSGSVVPAEQKPLDTDAVPLSGTTRWSCGRSIATV